MNILSNPVNSIEHPVLVLKKEDKEEDFFLRFKSKK